jgi:hypothetical protein
MAVLVHAHYASHAHLTGEQIELVAGTLRETCACQSARATDVACGL